MILIVLSRIKIIIILNSFKSIKNVMSDRRATQKKFKRLFTEFRFSILPDVIFNSNVEM